VLKAFCFSPLKADAEAIPWIFFTVHSHEQITVKILEFYQAHFDLLVSNGLTLGEMLRRRYYNVNQNFNSKTYFTQRSHF
jgi:hypothetical protein